MSTSREANPRAARWSSRETTADTQFRLGLGWACPRSVQARPNASACPPSWRRHAQASPMNEPMIAPTWARACACQPLGQGPWRRTHGRLHAFEPSRHSLPGKLAEWIVPRTCCERLSRAAGSQIHILFGHPIRGRAVQWTEDQSRMISRWLISLLLIAVAAWMSPWRLVCGTGCQQACCRSIQPSEPSSCCAMPAPGGQASCCAASAREEAQPAADAWPAESSCCATGDATSDDAVAPPCCLFVPINPCSGCDLLKLCLWAPWKGSPGDDALNSLERMGSQHAIASIPLPRAERMLHAPVPQHPPWTPRVGEFLSRICLLTI